MSSAPQRPFAGETDSLELFRSLGIVEPRFPLGAFVFSVCGHAMTVAALVLAPMAFAPPALKLAGPQQLLDDGSHRLVWYKFTRDLPAVSPAEPPPQEQAASKPKILNEQRIQARGAKPSSLKQLIWGGPPEIELQQDSPLPNLLAWTLPRPEVSQPRFELPQPERKAPARKKIDAGPAPGVQPAAPQVSIPEPEPPRLRYRQEERPVEAPRRAALPAESAPRVESAQAAAIDLGAMQPVPRLRYRAQQKELRAPGRRAVDAAQGPEVAGASLPLLPLEPFTPQPRLRYRARQSVRAAPKARAAGAGEPAPRVRASASAGPEVGRFTPQPRLRYRGSVTRPATAPGKRAATGAAAAPSVEAGEPASSPGELLAAAGALPSLETVQKAVIGVNPAATAAELPEGNRSARFSAGPDASPEGSPGAPAGDPGSGLRLPQLTIDGEPPRNLTRDSLVAGAREDSGSDEAPEPEVLLARAARPADFRQLSELEPPAISPGGSTPVVHPEKPFVGKPVYSMAVNLPNVTSYSGSWEIKFAELDPNEDKDGNAAPPPNLSFPTPTFKVDPRYLAAAIQERIEGEVILHAIIRRDGNVDTISVVKSLDERLDQSAVEALKKWRFAPAAKEGVPVDIEALVKIPFRLAPGEAP